MQEIRHLSQPPRWVFFEVFSIGRRPTSLDLDRSITVVLYYFTNVHFLTSASKARAAVNSIRGSWAMPTFPIASRRGVQSASLGAS